MIKIIFVRHGQSTENVAINNGTEYDHTNIKLTKLGKKQARQTGKYLNKIFGKFDIIYTSPIERCIETTNLIYEQLDLTDCEIKIENKIIEIGAVYHPFDGLSKTEINKLINTKYKAQDNLMKQVDNEKNPFDRYALLEKFEKTFAKLKIEPNLHEAIESLKIFFNQLKKSKHKQILVVTHGGIISTIQKMILGVDPEYPKLSISTGPFSDLNELIGNCCCMCVGIINNELKLVYPANTKHLKEKSK